MLGIYRQSKPLYAVFASLYIFMVSLYLLVAAYLVAALFSDPKLGLDLHQPLPPMVQRELSM